MRFAATLPRLALIEARRSALPWLLLAGVAAALGLAGFLSQVALTESLQLQAAIVAALLRAFAVFVVAIHVATSTVREFDDKGLELVLSLPLSRAAYYLGRLGGFALVALAVATALALPLFIWSTPGSVALWWLSLAAETVLVAAAALFFSMALAQLVPAIASVAGFYLLARAIGSIQAMASGPLAEPTLAQDLARRALEGIALVLPRLDAATRTEWLLYGAPTAGEFGAALLGLALYVLLLVAAGLFDFHRRNL